MSYFQQCQQSPLHYAHNAMPVDVIVVPGKFGYIIKQLPYIHPNFNIKSNEKNRKAEEEENDTGDKGANSLSC